MNIQKNNNIQFQGFGISGTVPAKVAKEFLEKPKNIELINELESRAVDLFMSSEGKEVQFVSKKYGDLKHFGVGTQLVEGVEKITSNMSGFMKKIEKAKVAAEKEYSKYERDSKLNPIRGC